ncbi:hypothetical protein M0813_11747 [Anaeramoeba flamelloides]|uniref:Uncharacterized protein n=1 Tax=Anaeramoeba flamelloides TaxID=1746091 RepID=A0ABQ8ZE12_9EUKA|nr:hypothetical protein M0813_11747 [Anaeramoeba flamelloides]
MTTVWMKTLTGGSSRPFDFTIVISLQLEDLADEYLDYLMDRFKLKKKPSKDFQQTNGQWLEVLLTLDEKWTYYKLQNVWLAATIDFMEARNWSLKLYQPENTIYFQKM